MVPTDVIEEILQTDLECGFLNWGNCHFIPLLRYMIYAFVVRGYRAIEEEILCW